jgi:Tfp pilus assembly protein PilN
VYLAGSGANLPYAREFFAEKLGLPVDYFNPLAKVSLGKSISPEAVAAEAHTMGELVGLAVHAIAKAKISIDLVPASVVADRASQRRQPIMIAAAAVLILGFAAFATLKNSAASSAEQELSKLNSQKQQLEATAQPIEKLLAHEQALQKVSQQYVAAEQDQVQWLGILNALRSHFASEFVWVTDLEPLANYDVLLPNDPKSKNGDSVVNGAFSGSTSYGISMLAAIKSSTPAVQKGKTPAPKA